MPMPAIIDLTEQFAPTLRESDLYTFSSYSYLPPFYEEIDHAHIWAVYMANFFYEDAAYQTIKDVEQFFVTFPIVTDRLVEITIAVFSYLMQNEGKWLGLFASFLEAQGETGFHDLAKLIYGEYSDLNHVYINTFNKLFTFASGFRSEYNSIYAKHKYMHVFKESYLQTFYNGYKPRSVFNSREDITEQVINDELRMYKQISWANSAHYEAAKTLVSPVNITGSTEFGGAEVEKARVWILLGLFPGIGLRPIAKAHIKNPDTCVHSYYYVGDFLSQCEFCGKVISAETPESFDYWEND